MIVAKFGGSSLANAEQFLKVKKIVESNPERRFIVPSAPGKRNGDDFKITDALYLCHEHIKKSVDFNGVYSLIYNRFCDLRDDLHLDFAIENELDEIKKKLLAGASADYAASRGEYLSGLLLAEFLGFEFVDPKEILVLKRNGKLDKEISFQQINQRLKNVKNVVIPGFYGATKRGKIKTFSRGGSDISGAVIAGALEADIYENWTDVSGFQMADPRITGKHSSITEITYKELRELSYMGAKVFHEEAIYPVLESKIAINIKNTNAPSHFGTMIVAERAIDLSVPITGISGKKDFTVINLEKTLLKQEKGLISSVIAILDRYDVSFEHMPSGIDSLSIIISKEELADKLDDLLTEFEELEVFDKVDFRENIALIAVVGEGMVRNLGISQKIFTALGEAKINISMINQGANELSIMIGVQNSALEPAIKAIYQAFN